MNCYLCLRAGVSTSAAAVCRSCGAACCIDHLEERTHAGHGPGMQPMLAPRVEILCERCAALQPALFSAARRKAPGDVGASTALTPEARRTLPDAQEAITTIEDLLGLERAEMPAPRKGWRRFFGRYK